MIDVDIAIRSYLASCAELTALVGERIWAGSDPPSGYQPQPVADNALTGPALTFKVKIGAGNKTGVLVYPLLLMHCIAADEATVADVDRRLKQFLDGAKLPAIKSIWRRDGTEPTTDRESGWVSLDSLYSCITTR